MMSRDILFWFFFFILDESAFCNVFTEKNIYVVFLIKIMILNLLIYLHIRARYVFSRYRI